MLSYTINGSSSDIKVGTIGAEVQLVVVTPEARVELRFTTENARALATWLNKFASVLDGGVP